jgi:hypothetical protein
MYNLAGVECSTADVGGGVDDVDARICQTCALPFGVRDTTGVYRTGPHPNQVHDKLFET